jgi:hypothetical protein
MSYLPNTSVSSVPSSVSEIVEVNRKAARVALNGLVLELKRTVVNAIGTKDKGSIDISTSAKYNQAAVVLMAQLTSDARVQGELTMVTTEDHRIRFQLTWDLTGPAK